MKWLRSEDTTTGWQCCNKRFSTAIKDMQKKKKERLWFKLSDTFEHQNEQQEQDLSQLSIHTSKPTNVSVFFTGCRVKNKN